MNRRRGALLVLEDGRSFAGTPIGRVGAAFGEVIFNTSMVGYQEILTDPSYCRQLVTFTAPQIGNYGVAAADDQGPRPFATGVIVRELSPTFSNWRAGGDLGGWLDEVGVVGISSVDTRALTRHIRQAGAMRGGIFSQPEQPVAALLEQVRAQPKMEGSDLASVVTTAEPYVVEPAGDCRGHLVAIDFGIKRGIVAALTRRGFRVTVVSASTTAEAIAALNPDGVVLSNGPGDPEPVKGGIETARALIGTVPILGICLGYQILALAIGGRSFKMPFGHHGGNHPVRSQEDGAVWITAQNHGFAVDPESLPAEATRTHVSLYDGTLEGFALPERQLIAVQFHPEACPGPSDAASVFDRFVDLVEPAARARADRAPAFA